MSLNPRHLLRMSRWSRRPPSTRRVILVFGVVLLCLALAGLERFVGIPEGLQREPNPKIRIE
ncbi:hypothetical protein OU789_06440 [Halocynthiibacter sp. C4]|nr:hypothetical protein [Halocynthiibacter sp. C4]MDE0589557.1 hypothetical protein [Halocynthiibacter sp. C4]